MHRCFSPPQECYLYTLHAASKWGRWDLIENLMDEMRDLRVGAPHKDGESEGEDEDAPGTEESDHNGGRVRGHAGGENGSRVPSLSSDCYAPLVEAYAQASMWDKTIEAYHEGFVGGLGRVEPVDYRVREERGVLGCSWGHWRAWLLNARTQSDYNNSEARFLGLHSAMALSVFVTFGWPLTGWVAGDALV